MDDAGIAPARHRLNVEDFYRMAEAGIFGEDDRIELIDGDLIDMAPIGQAHAGIVNALANALYKACEGKAIVSAQNPIRLDRASEPQPDLAVLRPRADFYATGEPPGPDDVLLLVEVADTSLNFDRVVKLPLYARAGIAELWIFDIKRRVVDAFKGPSGNGYAETITYRAGETVGLACAPDIAVKLNLVFG